MTSTLVGFRLLGLVTSSRPHSPIARSASLRCSHLNASKTVCLLPEPKLTSLLCAQGEIRTPTRCYPQRVLSPHRLPIPTPGQWPRPRPELNRRVVVLQTTALATSPLGHNAILSFFRHLFQYPVNLICSFLGVVNLKPDLGHGVHGQTFVEELLEEIDLFVDSSQYRLGFVFGDD